MSGLKYILIINLYLFNLSAFSQELKFSLHKLESDIPGPTLLVIGGIQGDEPGGFTAASMLVTDYKIDNGNVWVVPNLNFESIIKRSRGVYGDMNRKFKSLPKHDPEYNDVEKIKKIITDKKVDIVLNLHDGSGFYSNTYFDKWRNPRRWGQSIIIDQDEIDTDRFGNLSGLANGVRQYINQHTENKYAHFNVKNTNTRMGDVEMEKTLTYFSITNKKPAFGIEASKQYRTFERAYFHLLAVEGFMREMGINYSRNFSLSKKQVKHQIGSNLHISLYDERVRFNLANARRFLNFVPMKKQSPLEYKKNNPLLAVLSKEKGYRVRYGNRYVTSIRPQYYDYVDEINAVNIEVDGKLRNISVGEEVVVYDSFRVNADDDYRVNVIGYKKPGVTNENNILIKKENIIPRFSIDMDENIFRVELYKGSEFGGMFMVRFTSQTDNKYSFLNNKKQ